METLVLNSGDSSFLINAAHVAKTQADVSADLAASTETAWNIEEANPYITWVAGDFVEGDNPNGNKQFWTAGDLEIAEYTIKYAPLNMVHKFRAPIGFYAATRTVKLEREVAGAGKDIASPGTGSMKIQALSGIWSHLFPFETAQVEAADAEGLLFYSMECRGTHVTCAGDQGCGETYDYNDVKTHCDHLMDRSSIRHIVNPTFRGGALIVPPVRPGWKQAHAGILQDSIMQEAAAFAEQTQEQYNAVAANGVDITASGWEQLMAMVLTSRNT